MRAALLALLLACSPGSALAEDCPAPLKPMLRAELYFGRGIPGRGVNDTQWTRFTAEVLTAQFSNGLTILDGREQWRDGARIIRERSTVVIAVLPDGPLARERIAAAADAYKMRFHQKSVGIVTQTVCAGF
jgi:glucose/arabinose dehydrogenase